MLMFENGILATFIPEILMVIGFVLCLFTPGFISNNSNSEQAPIVAQVSTFEHKQTASYQLSTYHFQTTPEVVPDVHCSLPRFIENVIINRFETSFSTSDGLSFVDFSRPPPFFLS